MAFLVEDGTGLSDANSFASVADFDAYWADRGNASLATWTQSQKEQNLVKATDYLNNTFRSAFVGDKKSNTQRLAWPRINAYYQGESDPLDPWYCSDFQYPVGDNVVPKCLIEATCDLAVDANSNQLTPNVAPGAAQVTKKKIGPLEIDYAAGGINASTIWKRSANMISSILRGVTSNVQILRS